MKLDSLPLILVSLIIMVACSKTTKKNTVLLPPTPLIVKPDLPNTVEKTDTLNVMAYNVLNYGDGCQGNTTLLDRYFKTIIQYTQPDLLSCEKMASFPSTPGATGNLADEIANNVLNAAFPNRYAYAIPTNSVNANNMSTLFYNKQILSFVKTSTLEANITDFDLYKLYYNDPNLSITRDTTFLYVVVNHTQSGSESATRDLQVCQEMQVLRAKFSYLPNLINMGDFNTRSSLEAGYQAIVTSKDTATVMSDPPFNPDAVVHYPASWDSSPSIFSAFLSTSTRQYASVPNTCGTSGGAKSWYDHIFLSPWLVKGSDYMKYLPASYRTIGNDDNRLGVDITSSTPIVNNSAPAAVLEALFHFSNKYPVSIKLLVRANRNASSLADPAEKN